MSAAEPPSRSLSYVIRYLTSAPRVGLLGALMFGVWGVAFVAHHALSTTVVSGDNVVLGRDFMAFYIAGRIVADGNGRNVYDPQVQQQTQDAVLAPERLSGLSYFINPAAVAVAYSGLARLSYLAAFFVHTAIMVGCFFTGVWLLRPHLKSLGTRWVMVALPAICWFPMMHTVTGGQNAALSFLLLAAAYAGVVEGRDWKLGIAVGLLLFKPQYAVPLLGLLLLGGHWRAVGLAGLVGLGQFALGAWFCGWDWPLRMLDQLSGYYRLNEDASNSATHISFLEVLDYSLVRPLSGHPQLAGVVHLAGLLVLAAAVIGLMIMWRRGDSGSDGFGACFALVCTVTLLLSPHTQYYDGALLLLPVLLLLEVHGRRGLTVPDWLRALLLLGYVLYLPVVQVPLRTGIPFQPAVLAVIGVAVWAAWLLRPRVTRNHCLILGAFGIAVMLLQFEALQDVDIHWQVKLGQLMWQQGRLIEADPFTFTHLGAVVPTLGWLSQLIFAEVYDLASWRGLQIVHAVLFAGAFGIAAATAVWGSGRRQPGVDLLSVGAALFLGFLAGITSSMVRPQSFAVCSFAILLAVVQTPWRLRTRLLVVAPLVVLWQNLHPSVAVGACAVGALTVSAWITRRFGGQRADPWGMAALLLVVLLAQLATPMGWGVFSVSADNLRVARDVLGVSEWLHPWAAAVRPAMAGGAVAAVVSVLLLIRLRFRVGLDDLVLFGVMTALALLAARFVIFWAVACVPLWARWIGRARPSAVALPGAVPAAGRWVAACLAVGWPLALVLPTVLRGETTQAFDLQQGIDRLAREVPQGRIYNYREWGGPLILAGYPGWRVAYDGRLYLFGDDDWRAYRDAALGVLPLGEIERRYEPDAFFLRPGFHQKLIERLDRSRAWKQAFANRHCTLYVRTTPAGLAGGS